MSELQPRDIEARERLRFTPEQTERIPSVTSLEALVILSTMLMDLAADCYAKAKVSADVKDTYSAMRHAFKATQVLLNVTKLIEKSSGAGNVPPRVRIVLPEGTDYQRDENGDIVVTPHVDEG
jgi:hypothetical protein